jgi:hypothetical protein
MPSYDLVIHRGLAKGLLDVSEAWTRRYRTTQQRRKYNPWTETLEPFERVGNGWTR